MFTCFLPVLIKPAGQLKYFERRKGFKYQLEVEEARVLHPARAYFP